MTIGAKFKAAGYTPHHPIIIIPGLCSSCLAVVESPYEEWIDKQIWLSLTSIGFDKMLSFGNFMKSKGKKVEETVEKSNSFDEANKRKWIMHMCPKDDGFSDPEGIKVRAVKGIKGCAYLEALSIMNSLSYVMGPLVEALKEAGFVEGENMEASPYDWRIPPCKLQERDGYFDQLKLMVERLYAKNNNSKVVFMAHSLGTRCVQYFLRWIEVNHGRAWTSQYIENWIALGPLWLGAPKSIRAILCGERMGLDDFLYPEEGIALSRKCGSSTWMFPILTPDYPFQEYGFVRDKDTNKFTPKPFDRLFPDGGCSVQWDLYNQYYIKDPYHGPHEELLKAPPIDKMLVIYGINLKTETMFFFKENPDPKRLTVYDLDPEGSFPGYACDGGIGFETKDTPQNILRGKQRSGDGTVPYASLAYCRNWSKSVNVRIEELEDAEHREVLKDKRFHRLVLETVCKAPPLSILPATFSKTVYSVQKLVASKEHNVLLCLQSNGIKVKTKSGPKVKGVDSFHPYQSVVNILADDSPDTFTIEFQKTGSFHAEVKARHVYKTSERDKVLQEITQRCEFLDEGSTWYEEERDESGRTELHLAALENRLDKVMDRLQQGYDINGIDLRGWTPLHYACHSGNLEIALELLRQSDLSVNRKTLNHETALHLLVLNQYESKSRIDQMLRVVEFLKSRGANLNAKNHLGQSALIIAAERNNLAVAEGLCAKNLNVNLQDKDGNTPLHIAIKIGSKEMVNLLSCNGADKHIKNNLGQSPLSSAKATNPALFDILSGRGRSSVQVKPVVLDPVIVALESRDEYDQTALHRAAFNNNINEVYDLIFRGCDVNVVDKNDWTPLHSAANQGNLELMMILMKCGDLEVNAQTKDKTSVLHYLVRREYDPVKTEIAQSVLRKMISMGAQINSVDKYGETALHQACMRRVKWALEDLIELGADLNLCNSRGFTPLHFAIQTRNLPFVQYLIAKGADTSNLSLALDLAKDIPDILAFLTSVPTKKRREPPPPRRQRLSKNMGEMSVNSSGGSVPLAESPETTSSDYSSDEETFDDEDVVPLDDKTPLKESTLVFRKKKLDLDEPSSPRSRALARSTSGFLAKTRSPTSDTRSSGLLSGPRRSEKAPTVNWRKSSETSLVESSPTSSSSSSLPVAAPKTFEGKSSNQRVTVILLEDGSAKDVLLDVDFLSAPPSPASLSEDIKEAINDAVSRLARSSSSSSSSFS